jgi:hypothetical protein
VNTAVPSAHIVLEDVVLTMTSIQPLYACSEERLS